MNIFDTPKTRFISHRGFTPLAPENSLPSFYYAGMLGQWAIETDLRVTRDGKIVCCHNGDIDSYCNGSGQISEMTYQELCQFEIVRGNRWDCFREEERKIPLFSEYLSICKRFGSVPFIELKTGDIEYIIHQMRKNGFSDEEVVISSAELSDLTQSRQYAPKAFLHWIFAQEEKLEELCSLGNAGMSWKIADPFSCDKQKQIASVQKMGLKVCLRAADSVSALKQMQLLGLDYFPTNTMHDKGEKR